MESFKIYYFTVYKKKIIMDTNITTYLHTKINKNIPCTW